MRRSSGPRTECLAARARKQARASSVPRAPGLSETDRAGCAGCPFYTRARSLDQLVPGRSPSPGPSLEVRHPHCASPQVHNVHGAFNALGGADRLTSNRMYHAPTPGTAFRPSSPGQRGRKGDWRERWPSPRCEPRCSCFIPPVGL